MLWPLSVMDNRCWIAPAVVKMFAISPIRAPQSGNSLLLAFGTVPKVGMVDAPEVDALAVVD